MHPYATLNEFKNIVELARNQIAAEKVAARIRARDHTLWKPEPAEISNRLGWLDCPEKMARAVPQMEAFAEEARAGGYTHALLLGMGGSSLAPEMFRAIFGVKDGYLDLAVLDSTDPGAVAAAVQRGAPAKTLCIVSTKSGGTVETISFFKYCYQLAVAAVGKEEAGTHFIAITDPGSGLEKLAKEYRFRKIFLNDPEIGGRYSALSYFGLVPAALGGVDIGKLLDSARRVATTDKGDVGVLLGAYMGELARLGRDKLTIVLSPRIGSFGAWIEQLVAESLGKEGKGILPVVEAAPGPPEVYGPDRAFVYIRLGGDDGWDAWARAIVEAGEPLVQLNLESIGDLGAEIYRWEMAVAIAGQRLGVNPFDQPNVEAAKARAREMAEAFSKEGTLPEAQPSVQSNGLAVWTACTEESAEAAIKVFLAQAEQGDYIALQAYIEPTEANGAALREIQERLRDKKKLAVTAGYGPRFLHSTGQLHKGDAGRGLFVQITGGGAADIGIPDSPGGEASSMTFGVLKAAQAMGDRQALLEAGRRVIRVDLGEDVEGGLRRLASIAA